MIRGHPRYMSVKLFLNPSTHLVGDDVFIFNSNGYLVLWSGKVWAILLEYHPRNISVRLFPNLEWFQMWSGLKQKLTTYTHQLIYGELTLSFTEHSCNVIWKSSGYFMTRFFKFLYIGACGKKAPLRPRFFKSIYMYISWTTLLSRLSSKENFCPIISKCGCYFLEDFAPY